MAKTIRNFLAAILGTAILLFLSWVYVRGRALSQPVKDPHPHAFFTSFPSDRPLLIAHRGGWKDFPENTVLAFEKVAALDKDQQLAFWVDIRPTLDGTLVAFRDRELSTTTDGKGWIGYTADADLEKLDAGFKFQDASGNHPYRGQGLRIPKLKELLEKFPDRKWVLNFHDHRPGLDHKIVEIIEAAKAGDRVLISSPEDGFLRDMRERKAMWLYSTSQAQGTRLKMMDSVGLSPAVPLHGDVFVFETGDTRPSLYALPKSVIDEVHRRKMKLITGPVQDQESVKELFAQGIDGVLISHPTKVMDQSSP